MEQPPIGWTTTAKLKRVIDADTIVVSVEREFTVRLVDFDAPETHHPKTEAERQHGESATAYLEYLLKGANIVMCIPASENDRLKDIYSIGGRVQGHIFADGIDVRQKLKEQNFEKRSDYGN